MSGPDRRESKLESLRERESLKCTCHDDNHAAADDDDDDNHEADNHEADNHDDDNGDDDHDDDGGGGGEGPVEAAVSALPTKRM